MASKVKKISGIVLMVIASILVLQGLFQLIPNVTGLINQTIKSLGGVLVALLIFILGLLVGLVGINIFRNRIKYIGKKIGGTILVAIASILVLFGLFYVILFSVLDGILFWNVIISLVFIVPGVLLGVKGINLLRDAKERESDDVEREKSLRREEEKEERRLNELKQRATTGDPDAVKELIKMGTKVERAINDIGRLPVKETKKISVRDGKDTSFTDRGKDIIKNYWGYGWDLESITGRTEEEALTRYSVNSTPYVDLHFVRDKSIPIIAKLAKLENELEENKWVNTFEFPGYTPAPKKPVKSDFFFGIGYNAANDIYKEKFVAWEKDNEKYNEVKAKADADIAIIKNTCTKIQEEAVSLQNDNLRQESLRQGLEIWQNRPRREFSTRVTG